MSTVLDYDDRGGFLRETSLDGTGALVVSEREDLRHRYDWYDPGDGSAQVRYHGSAIQGQLTSDAVWRIRRYSHSSFLAQMRVTDVQVLIGAWDSRASLPWS